MAGCKVVNQAMVDAKEAIIQIANEYNEAGNNLITSLTAALSEMQGAAKESLFENFIDKVLKTFVQGMDDGAQSLPSAVKGMGTLLEANRTNFVEVDQSIAKSISGS